MSEVAFMVMLVNSKTRSRQFVLWFELEAAIKGVYQCSV